MKKSSIIIIIILIGIAIGLVVFFSKYKDLQVQILRQVQIEKNVSKTKKKEIDCKKLSEGAANICFKKKAIEEKDKSYCDEISKASSLVRCKREIELSL